MTGLSILYLVSRDEFLFCFLIFFYLVVEKFAWKETDTQHLLWMCILQLLFFFFKLECAKYALFTNQYVQFQIGKQNCRKTKIKMLHLNSQTLLKWYKIEMLKSIVDGKKMHYPTPHPIFSCSNLLKKIISVLTSNPLIHYLNSQLAWFKFHVISSN